MLTSVDGKNFVRQSSWAWIAGSTYYVPSEAVGMVRETVEPEPVAADADRLKALTAENERLREALEEAPIIGLRESGGEFKSRQDNWLKTKAFPALGEKR
jgi:hypothetical protein